jgi:hypothetical protein
MPSVSTEPAATPGAPVPVESIAVRKERPPPRTLRHEVIYLSKNKNELLNKLNVNLTGKKL